ncbi:hypothetical protein VTI74DRAFT_7395 [Chaetomium olivicolor]
MTWIDKACGQSSVDGRCRARPSGMDIGKDVVGVRRRWTSSRTVWTKTHTTHGAPNSGLGLAGFGADRDQQVTGLNLQLHCLIQARNTSGHFTLTLLGAKYLPLIISVSEILPFFHIFIFGLFNHFSTLSVLLFLFLPNRRSGLFGRLTGNIE